MSKKAPATQNDKFAILPLSLYHELDQQKTISKFAELGASKFGMFLHWRTLNRLFDRYKMGDLSTEQFQNAIFNLFPALRGNVKGFQDAWNAMCTVNDTTRTIFKHARELQKNDVTVYFIASTNDLHFRHLKKQIGNNLPGNFYLSYEHKVLDHNLRRKLISEINQKNSSAKIALFYKPAPPAPYAWLGPLAWLVAPAKKWFHRIAERFVARLQQEIASTPSVSLVLSPDLNSDQTLKSQLHDSLQWDLQEKSQPKRRRRTHSDLDFVPTTSSSDDEFSSNVLLLSKSSSDTETASEPSSSSQSYTQIRKKK